MIASLLIVNDPKIIMMLPFYTRKSLFSNYLLKYKRLIVKHLPVFYFHLFYVLFTLFCFLYLKDSVSWQYYFIHSLLSHINKQLLYRQKPLLNFSLLSFVIVIGLNRLEIYEYMLLVKYLVLRVLIVLFSKLKYMFVLRNRKTIKLFATRLSLDNLCLINKVLFFVLLRLSNQILFVSFIIIPWIFMYGKVSLTMFILSNIQYGIGLSYVVFKSTFVLLNLFVKKESMIFHFIFNIVNNFAQFTLLILQQANELFAISTINLNIFIVTFFVFVVSSVFVSNYERIDVIS